jgi:hypothetical protein
MKADAYAFLFSVDKEEVYKPTDSKKAIQNWSQTGPSFGDFSLKLGYYKEQMNSIDGGIC